MSSFLYLSIDPHVFSSFLMALTTKKETKEQRKGGRQRRWEESMWLPGRRVLYPQAHANQCAKLPLDRGPQSSTSLHVTLLSWNKHAPPFDSF